jgi:hypothetical protein
MRTRVVGALTIGLFAVAGFGYGEEAKNEGTANVPETPEWQAADFGKLSQPRSVGVLVINYQSFSIVDGEPKEFLKPKLGTGYARTNLTEWLSYKPAIATNSVSQLIIASIVAQIKSIGGPITLDPKALLPGQSVGDGLGQFKGVDMLLVLSVDDPKASLTTLFAGEQFASVIMPMDFVLLSKDCIPLMTYNKASFERLDTIGEMEKGYDKAEPFRQKVSFRYSLDALVRVTAPVVVGIVKSPFLAGLNGLAKQQ